MFNDFGGGIAPIRHRTGREAYLGSHFPTEQKPPLKILVQFDRESGKYEVRFEDDDASRWKVTPTNIEQISKAACSPAGNGGGVSAAYSRSKGLRSF